MTRPKTKKYYLPNFRWKYDDLFLLHCIRRNHKSSAFVRSYAGYGGLGNYAYTWNITSYDEEHQHHFNINQGAWLSRRVSR